MIIDFHTHMFPEKIAAKTIAHLAEVCNKTPATDGTAAGLSASTKMSGVDLSIVLPVATKPSQFRTINNYAMQFRDGNLLSFGSVHPGSPDYKEELREIREMGFLGIKLHPDYQGMDFNDIRCKRVVECATKLGLIVVVHAGLDPLCPEHVHCTPAMSAEVIRDVRPDKLVLAHLGGNQMWDEVERELVGLDVYLDTAVIFDRPSIAMEQFYRIVRTHGKERILFATDCPWGNQKQFVDILTSCELDPETKTCILETNAKRLLRLEN